MEKKQITNINQKLVNKNDKISTNKNNSVSNVLNVNFKKENDKLSYKKDNTSKNWKYK